MERKIKQRKFIIYLIGLLVIFLCVIMFGDVLLFVFENKSNPAIHTLGDGLRLIETIFKVSGDNAIYPETTAGRVVGLLILISSIGLMIAFTATMFAFVDAMTFQNTHLRDHGRRARSNDKDMSKSQGLEPELLHKQKKISKYEAGIMEKLDKLREENNS